MEKEINCSLGYVKVRDVMVDLDGTNLEEGIEVKGDGVMLEFVGYTAEEMTAEKLDELVGDIY